MRKRCRCAILFVVVVVCGVDAFGQDIQVKVTNSSQNTVRLDYKGEDQRLFRKELVPPKSDDNPYEVIKLTGSDKYEFRAYPVAAGTRKVILKYEFKAYFASHPNAVLDLEKFQVNINNQVKTGVNFYLVEGGQRKKIGGGVAE